MSSGLINKIYLNLNYFICSALVVIVNCNYYDNFIAVNPHNENTCKNSVPQNLIDYISIPELEENAMNGDYGDSRAFNKKPFIAKPFDFQIGEQTEQTAINLRQQQIRSFSSNSDSIIEEIVEPDESYLIHRGSTPSILLELDRICSVPKDVEYCDSRVECYFFNNTARFCQKYSKGCCEETENKFENLLQCNNKCIRPVPVKRRHKRF